MNDLQPLIYMDTLAYPGPNPGPGPASANLFAKEVRRAEMRQINEIFVSLNEWWKSLQHYSWS